MTEQEFKTKATELVRQIVDSIADKEYAKLASFAQINSSWVESGITQEEAFLEFGEWLEEQLAVWEEYEKRKFVVDHFDESCLDDIELVNDISFETYHPTYSGKCSFVTYFPTNSGEPLDFCFEMNFKVDKTEQISVTFNVNI